MNTNKGVRPFAFAAAFATWVSSASPAIADSIYFANGTSSVYSFNTSSHTFALAGVDPRSTVLGLTAGPSGQIYLGLNNSGIDVFNPGGAITTLASATFSGSPVFSLARDSGSGTVFAAGASGVISAISSAGQSLYGYGLSGALYGNMAVASGNLWAATYNSSLFRLSLNNAGYVTSSLPVGPAFSTTAIAAGPDGNLYYVGYGISGVAKFSPSGALLNVAQLPGNPLTNSGLTFDSSGNLWVASQSADALFEYSLTGGTASLLFTQSLTGYGTPLAIASVPSAVPLPAAAWLMISGLGGIGAFARRRKLT